MSFLYFELSITKPKIFHTNLLGVWLLSIVGVVYNKMAAGGGICKVLSDSKGNLLVEFNNVTVLCKVSGIYTVYIVINSVCIVYRITSSH